MHRSSLFLSVVIAIVPVVALAALFETSDFTRPCANSPAIQVPAEFRGKYLDTKSSGWIEVDADGISRIEWSGFYYYSRQFAERGYCVRQEIIPEADGQGVRLVLERNRDDDGFVSEREAHTINLLRAPEGENYLVSAGSSGGLTLGFLPIGGSTMIEKKHEFTREAPKADLPRAETPKAEAPKSETPKKRRLPASE